MKPQRKKLIPYFDKIQKRAQNFGDENTKV